MKTVLGLLLLASVSVCFSQQEDGKLKHTQKPVPTVSSGPVTIAEADAAFGRVAELFKSVLHVSVSPKRSRGKPSAPITRGEIVAEMFRLYKAVEPKFTVTPATVPVDLPRLVTDKPSEKRVLTFLVERGCVGNYGPLATGKKSTVAISDFGDSLGYFIARISECTHMPSSKWTPYLHE